MNPNPLPKTNTSLNVLEVPKTNASQEVIPHSIDLDVTVKRDSITRGKNQAVMRWHHRTPLRVKSFIEFLSDSKLRTQLEQ